MIYDHEEAKNSILDAKFLLERIRSTKMPGAVALDVEEAIRRLKMADDKLTAILKVEEGDE